ncbi:MAG TPA: lipid-A-disaccharide synthase N-terminal domain-containing protein [Tepidisphaeraceae bacterium]|nr:lipid-A-disaccharide synthase N-terminal domain-containing protein [Tepidisphaeraceae bacterium]
MGNVFHQIYALLSGYHMPFEDNYLIWKTIGYVGMAMFFGRFLIQWLYSEKHGESKVPITFWWQSLIGTVLMLLYSLRQHDPVYILGYVFNVVPYSRNLVLIYRKRREEESRGFEPVTVGADSTDNSKASH